VEGRTLEDRLKDGPLPAAEAAGYICQALSALGYAHERGVVHRDIKPANIMVTPAGQVKLMDFGIAKAVADRRLTMTGTTLGSLFYMSPEQVKGSTDLDGRSDLYSVGVSLYEMVTGQRPFKGDSDYSIMVAHLEQQPVPPIQIDPTLPVMLNEIILTAIQKDREARFQTAQAFRAALETVAGSLPQEALAARPVVPPPAPVPQDAPTVATAPPAWAQPQAAPPPPPPQAPPQMAAQQPPVQWAPPPVAAQPAPPRSGHRGLWMAMGGIVVLAVLVLAAIQVPRWVKARASGETATQVADATPTPAPSPSPMAEATPAMTPEATPAAVEPLPAPAVSEQPAATMHERRRVSGTSPRSGRIPATQEYTETPSAPAQQAEPPAAPPQPPAQPAVDTALLESLQDRLGQLGPRASAIAGALQNLQRQQNAAGYGLRTDISASWKRMEYLLDQAEAALKDSDARRAKKNLDLAEREVEKLDKFLGH
jgi:hypothetical protein